MYVQWVSRNRDHKHGGVLIAQLVESKRVDGKPRKRKLAHLGSCRREIARKPYSPQVRIRQ
jgi:hypothetical protein